MKRMIIVNNHPDMYKLTGGVTIVFTETEQEYERAITRVDVALGNGLYSHCIPTATSAEIYIQRGSIHGTPTDGTDRDYLFAFECTPSESREAKLAVWNQRRGAQPLGSWYDRAF